MKRILVAAAAVAMLGAATVPASAQIWAGADPGGVGVQVGPFGVGVGPDYWGYRGPYGHDYAYAPCHPVRERIVTRYGHVYWRTRSVCD